MEVQNQVIGIVYALCAGMLFFWAVPSFVLRRWERVRSSKFLALRFQGWCGGVVCSTPSVARRS